MNNDCLTLSPLGGLGNIGANMQLVETSSHRLLIDCGILFPRDDHFGLNFLIPDFYSALEEKSVDGIIITHGHEDHIGAITFLARHYPSIPVYAPPFAAALIRKKTDELKISIKVIPYFSDIPLLFGDLSIIPFEVTHSIPQTYGLVLKDQQNSFALAYLSDFKLDRQRSLFPRLKNLLDGAKLRVLLSDSTNILSEHDHYDEESLAPHFIDLFAKAKERIFLTCFSSNIYRLQTIIDSAAAMKKIVVPHGRSMHFYISTAQELGLLHDPQNVLRTSEQIDVESSNQVVLLSGCQGEFKGTLRRVAYGEDSTYKPTERDIFIFSSKTIPGNEFSIGQILNELSKKHIQIVTASDCPIHSSGHIAWPELRELYDAISPDLIIPVHGESFFLLRHVTKLASSHPHIKTLMMTNGDSLHLSADATYRHQIRQEIEPLFIHGNDIVIERPTLSERRKLSSEGLVSIAIDLESVHLRHPRVTIEFFGLPQTAKDQLSHFENFMIIFLKSLKIIDKTKAKEEIRVAARRYFIPFLGYRPVAIIHLL